MNITASYLRHQKIERDFDKSKRELQSTKIRRSDTFSTPIEHMENIRTKLKNNYNQLMQVD